MAKRAVNQKKTVFISHISDETEVARWGKARMDRDFLGTLDIFVSSDRSTIAAGRKWLDEVDKALKRADLQIVLCSPTGGPPVGQFRGWRRLVARHSGHSGLSLRTAT